MSQREHADTVGSHVQLGLMCICKAVTRGCYNVSSTLFDEA